MDFTLTEEQKMLKAMVKDFAEKELEPIAAELDKNSRFPTESINKLGNLGLLGLSFPEEYGGGGGGIIESNLATEEISRVCAATGTIYFVTTGLAGYPIYQYSNEEQRKRFVPPLASGQKLSAFALTEAGAGSDPSSMETTAVRCDKGYIINGNKNFITNGKEADLILVFATINKELKHKGITAFVVEKGTPGFSVGKLEHKLGIRASSTAELIFDNCFVPEENRLGREGDGFKIALNAIDKSRVSVAAQAVGISQGAFEKSLEYAKERQQFGQFISNFQAIQWMLADMATRIDAARLLTYRAAYLQDHDLPFVKEACMAKLFSAEVAVWVTNKAIQIFGGYGYVQDYPLERYYRDAKITEIYEGTSEMQRLTIARNLLR